MKDKKIMFFIPSLNGGGAERTVINLANAMAECGFQIDLVVLNLNAKNQMLKDEVSPKVKLVSLEVDRMIKSIFKLTSLLKKNNYDVVYSSITHTNIISSIAKILSTKKFKLIVREVSSASMASKQMSPLMVIFLRKIVPFLYKRAYKVICVSKGGKEDFIKHYHYNHDNIDYIYDPVINEDYYVKLKETVTHPFLKNGNRVILGLGRFTKAKNFPLLLNSFAKIYKKNSNVRLLLIGDGELREQYEDLVLALGITDVVSMPGFIQNPFPYFKLCDLFVFSSEWEGLGGTIIQALPTKIKILSTDCPNGPSEILDNGKYGVLIPSNDENAMIQAMQEILNGNYIDIDDEALEQHYLQFTQEQVVEKYLILQE